MQKRTQYSSADRGRLYAQWNMADLTVRRLDELLKEWNRRYSLALVEPETNLPLLYAVTRTVFNEVSPLILIYFGQEQYFDKAKEWKQRIFADEKASFWQFRKLFNAVADMIENGQYEMALNILEELSFFFRAVLQEFQILFLIDYKPPRPGVETPLIKLYGEAYIRALERVEKEWKEKVIG